MTIQYHQLTHDEELFLTFYFLGDTIQLSLGIQLQTELQGYPINLFKHLGFDQILEDVKK